MNNLTYEQLLVMQGKIESRMQAIETNAINNQTSVERCSEYAHYLALDNSLTAVKRRIEVLEVRNG